MDRDVGRSLTRPDHTGRPSPQMGSLKSSVGDSDLVVRDESQSYKPTITVIYNLEPVKAGAGDPDLVLRGYTNTCIKPDSIDVHKSASVSFSSSVGSSDLARGDSTNVKEIKEVSSINTSTAINLILPVNINGITVEAIVDTGAQITVINEKLTKQLKIPEVRGDSMYLKGIDANSKIKARNGGEARILIGKTETKWQLIVVDKTETKWRLIVVEITDHVIIGLELLYHLHAIIDLAKYTIKLDQKN